TEDTELQEDFRRRALISALSVGAMAGLSFILSSEGAPAIRRGLGSASWSIPFHFLTGAMALWAIWTIWNRQFRLARILVPIQVTLIIFGWGLAQYPYLVTPDLTFSNTAAPDTVLRPLLIVLIAGGVLLVPAFWYLYAVFKGAARKAGQTKEEIGP
ncbi:MAG: cytochrome d ubiquinol oxidase subunit II, partial [Candidatus Poribacteria bacterium]|nr:cytochrome d ubiquinol oxidase subunit II [Candidatus Poribacteria bacterium]